MQEIPILINLKEERNFIALGNWKVHRGQIQVWLGPGLKSFSPPICFLLGWLHPELGYPQRKVMAVPGLPSASLATPIGRANLFSSNFSRSPRDDSHWAQWLMCPSLNFGYRVGIR